VAKTGRPVDIVASLPYLLGMAKVNGLLCPSRFPMNLRALLVCLASLTAGSIFGQTTVASWSMGDNDAAAAAGNTVNSTLTATTGANLTAYGSGLTYVNDTAPGSAGSLAVNFTGLGYYNTADNLGLTAGFALETWVKFSDVSATQWVMRVGNGGNNGAGIILNNGTLGAINSGDLIYGNSDPLTADTWYHTALVVDDAQQAQLYVNGSLISGATFTVNSFAANFGFGGDENGAAPLYGTLDDAKVFTFAPGTFTTAMLNYPLAAVPEPAAYAALAGLAAFGFIAWRRRKSA
jgi:hypothetical protein